MVKAAWATTGEPPPGDVRPFLCLWVPPLSCVAIFASDQVVGLISLPLPH
jgi:hypothetical protein